MHTKKKQKMQNRMLYRINRSFVWMYIKKERKKNIESQIYIHEKKKTEVCG